jgi:hypothetical protein
LSPAEVQRVNVDAEKKTWCDFNWRKFE